MFSFANEAKKEETPREFMDRISVAYTTYRKDSTESNLKILLDMCVPLEIVPDGGGRDERLTEKTYVNFAENKYDDIQFLDGNVACLAVKKKSSIGRDRLLGLFLLRINNNWKLLGADIKHIKGYDEKWQTSFDKTYQQFKAYSAEVYDKKYMRK